MTLSWFIISFWEIFLNFIVKLLFSMLDKQVYDLILIMIDCCTQMLLYILIIKIIITLVLIEFLRKKVFDCFGYPDGIVQAVRRVGFLKGRVRLGQVSGQDFAFDLTQQLGQVRFFLTWPNYQVPCKNPVTLR